MEILKLINFVENSIEFKNFKDSYPNAYLCAFFLVKNCEDPGSEEEKEQLDYFVSDEKVMTFSILNGKLSNSWAQLPKKEKIPLLNLKNVKVDKRKALEIAEKESEIGKFSKIIAVLQNIDGKEIWNVTCIGGLRMMRYHISALNGELSKKEKINLMDIMKIESSKKSNNLAQTDFSPKNVRTNIPNKSAFSEADSLKSESEEVEKDA